MRSACYRKSAATYLVAAAVAFTCNVTKAASADEGAGKDLIGSWEIEGKVIVYSADGAGTNHDSSRFRWRLNEGRLIARQQAPDGTLGEKWSVPIAFTKDRKEFSYLLGGIDGGRRRVTCYKLDQEARRFQGRTDADRAYPADAEALKGEGPPDASAPSPKTAGHGPANAPPREAIVDVGPTRVPETKVGDTFFLKLRV